MTPLKRGTRGQIPLACCQTVPFNDSAATVPFGWFSYHLPAACNTARARAAEAADDMPPPVCCAGRARRLYSRLYALCLSPFRPDLRFWLAFETVAGRTAHLHARWRAIFYVPKLHSLSICRRLPLNSQWLV